MWGRKNTQNTQKNQYDHHYYEDDVKDAVDEEDDGDTTASGNVGFGGVNLGGSSIELKLVRPEQFEDVSVIAEHLLNGRTVVLNLEAANKDVARRIIDFLSGVAFSIDGQIKRVANNTYIITPNNVDVTDTGALRGESGAEED